MRDDCPISRNVIARQAQVLRIAEARGISIALLAAETGIADATLRSYVDKPSRPASMMPLSAFIKLARSLPDDLASLLIEDSGYILKPSEAGAKDWLGLGARASDLSAKVMRFQSTGGVIDHREDAELVEDLRQLAAEAEAQIAEAGRGGRC